MGSVKRVAGWFGFTDLYRAQYRAVARHHARLHQGDAASKAERLRNDSLLRLAGIYAAVVAGIAVKGVWDPLLAARGGERVQPPGWTAVLITAAVDVILGLFAFNKIHPKLDPEAKNYWIALGLAFENGFFWQSLIGPALGGNAQPIKG
ncbi:MAG TPA: hypothetical protein VF160_00525 [Candidatus Dormibacteraeota bacterium]